MGLFDKIKGAKDALTGGGANVNVQVGQVSLREAFDVTVQASSTGNDVKYSKVYIKIQGVEECEVEDGDSKKKVRGSAKTIDLVETVAPAGVLGANESDEWTIQVQLPQSATPEFKGKFTRHYYRIFAGLDTVGNDPDSGWQEFVVS